MAFFVPATLESIAASLDAKAKLNDDLADPNQFSHPPEMVEACKASAESYRRAAAIIRYQIECEA